MNAEEKSGKTELGKGSRERCRKIIRCIYMYSGFESKEVVSEKRSV